MTDRLETDHLEVGPTAAPAGAGARGEVVEVRRSAGALALVTLGAGVLGVLYAVKAVGGSPVLALVALMLLAIAALAGRSWWDARSPLLVADGLGVRFRHGSEWRGLPWSEVDHVVLDEPRGVFRDGALDVVARDGTAYVVPLGLSVHASHDDLASTLASLSGDPALVSAPTPAPPAPESDLPTPDLSAGPDDGPDLRRVPPNDAPDSVETDTNRGGGGEPEPAAAPAPEPVRTSAAARIDLPLAQSAGTSALAPGYKVVTALRASHGRPELVIDRKVDDVPAADRLAEQPETVEDSAPEEPRPTPEHDRRELGTLLRTARERVGVSVDDLAARTQIRAHVIESLEADDTSACGGDFYARGHLRAIAKVLGADPAPWIAAYDASYAQAPIPARAVFEAERASGARTIRVARGGRSWVALTVVVLVLAIIWGIGQLVIGGDDDAPPATVPTDTGPANANPSALAGLGAPTTNHLVIRGKEKKPTHVTVKDARGKTIWSGELAKGEFRRVSVVGPATVKVGRADAATVAVNGGKAKRLDEGSDKATATLGDS